MPLPVLMLDLKVVGPAGNIRTGPFDLFLPAVIAFTDGTLRDWPTVITSSFELCRRIDFQSREAVWDGRLSAVGPAGWVETVSRVLGRRDIDEVISDYAVLEAALSVRSMAVGLTRAIGNASFSEAGGVSVHPLSDKEKPTDDVPFGFGVSVARWRGVNPKAFVDFALGNGSPDAEAFLETVISDPSRWFNDIPSLEAALRKLAVDRDVGAFSRAVSAWNAMQDIEIKVPDRSVIVPSIWADSSDVRSWGADFLSSADELVKSLLKERWSWWVPLA